MAAKSENQLTHQDFSVFFNAAPVEFLGTTNVDLPYSPYQHYAFRVKNHQNFPTITVAEFASTAAPYTIEHLELRIDN